MCGRYWGERIPIGNEGQIGSLVKKMNPEEMAK